MQDIVLFGAGAMAREVSTLIQEINSEKASFHLVGYAVDDAFYDDGMKIRGVSVVSREWLVKHKDDVVCACAIGYPKERRKAQKELLQEGVRFTNLIHPTTIIGEGSVIGNGCILQGWTSITTDCTLGDGIFMNGDVTIGHDAVLEDYVTCFPRCQISGQVRIGEAVCIGAMAFINAKRKIGAEAVVAPGSIVFNNVKAGTHVMGNPAKRVEI